MPTARYRAQRLDYAAESSSFSRPLLEGGLSMGKVINCECGYVVRGQTDDELIANAEQHMKSVHPDLVGKMSRDDLLGMAEEA